MRISRRSLLKGAVAAGAATAVVGRAEAREKREVEAEAVGMLYDSTLCIGCRACVTKCKEANGLPYDRSADGLYDQPDDLNGNTKNVIKVLASEGGQYAFMKQQCMHCVDPSCVSVCMMGALHKEGQGTRHHDGEVRGSGIVLYDKNTCVGCRYCQIACPYLIPKFEWTKAFPLIVKCELCRHRADPKKAGPLAVANPACCEVCPREAVVYGKRAELLAEAKRRLAANPQKYNGHVYGEVEGGGTQVLYLAAKGVEFKQLGLPELPEESQAYFSEHVSHMPYLNGITPIALYAAAAFVVRRNRKKEEAAEHHGEGK
ncbi:hydrogenase 2 operon protein HybA [Anaeromyxobacter diazotrophicus]|uniref:Hydrogenase n=1 Tax=Anaeromyxobacter diazotrophicus TaxID=2590199 RepID=A0A7I9VFX9_9BACT|nr:hydrogenase 2 operon protein HybA [Anaeromyxobacter diazotrophicus]GEJ55292.1 hydrogenase [Anaeromyxobacter diazotrophicus]